MAAARKRAQESVADAGPSVQFINAGKIIRAEMRISGPGGPESDQVSEVESFR